MKVGNLISGSFSFPKSSLYIWKFSVHVLLKSSLKDFEHYLASMWNEHNLHGSLNILWHCLSLELKWKMTPSPGKHCWVFQICWHIECSTLTTSSFKIWNSSTGSPSPQLALFTVILHKAHLTLHSRMSGSKWVVITPLSLSGSWGSFLYSSSVYSCHLFLISSANTKQCCFFNCQLQALFISWTSEKLGGIVST